MLQLITDLFWSLKCRYNDLLADDPFLFTIICAWFFVLGIIVAFFSYARITSSVGCWTHALFVTLTLALRNDEFNVTSYSIRLLDDTNIHKLKSGRPILFLLSLSTPDFVLFISQRTRELPRIWPRRYYVFRPRWVLLYVNQSVVYYNNTVSFYLYV